MEIKLATSDQRETVIELIKVVQYFYGSHGFAPERWVHLRRRVDR